MVVFGSPMYLMWNHGVRRRAPVLVQFDANVLGRAIGVGEEIKEMSMNWYDDMTTKAKLDPNQMLIEVGHVLRPNIYISLKESWDDRSGHAPWMLRAYMIVEMKRSLHKGAHLLSDFIKFSRKGRQQTAPTSWYRIKSSFRSWQTDRTSFDSNPECFMVNCQQVFFFFWSLGWKARTLCTNSNLGLVAGAQ